MCVVLIVPKDVRPSVETLRLCERANPDGGGIAWRSNGVVEWLKTNDVARIDRLARKIRGKLVIHFRVASVGPVCNELRHPFPITRKAALDERGRDKAVLFQNGTWNGWRAALSFAQSEGHRLPEGEMSDTRAAAFLCSIYGHGFLSKCGGSRWVYFSATQTVRFGHWHEHEGIHFSNLGWLPRAPQFHPAGLEKSLPTGHPASPRLRRIVGLERSGGLLEQISETQTNQQKLNTYENKIPSQTLLGTVRRSGSGSRRGRRKSGSPKKRWNCR